MKENIMGTKKILPLIMTMGFPPMISMLIQSLYNIVDSMFVARLGENALTAVSLAFPMQNIVLAVAVGFGVGINSVIARALGSQNQNEVNNATAHGFVLTAIHSLLFILVGIFFTAPFLKLFTSNSTTLTNATLYCRIVICFSFGQLFHIYIEKLFQAVGNVITPMIMQIVGAVINIILDPIFIFGYFNMPALGVSGAAIATVIGQMSACLLSIFLFMKYKGQIQVTFKNFHFHTQIIRKIYEIAFPSSLMTAMPSLLVGILNGILAPISSTSVAVFGLYYKVQTFVYMPANGIIQGMRPIIGYNYGAKKYDRVKETIKKCIMLIGSIMLMGTCLFCFVPEFIMNLFSASKDMIQIGIPALRIISLGFIISTIGIVFSGVFEALGKGKESLIISVLRQLLIIPLLSLILKDILGLIGIWSTFMIAETIASVTALFIYHKIKTKIFR